MTTTSATLLLLLLSFLVQSIVAVQSRSRANKYGKRKGSSSSSGGGSSSSASGSSGSGSGSGGGVDLWADLLMACFVIFVVLAPSLFFRVKDAAQRSPESKQSATATQAAVAGAIAGGATRLIAAPFDLVKIRFQVQQAPISKAAVGAKYVTFVQSIKSIHGEEGLKSFWRGNLAATGLWVSYSAIQFGCYRSLNGVWPEKFRERHGTTVSTLSGALSGVVATAITYPLDLFRTIFASQGVPKQFPTMQSLIAHTWDVRGVRGFYSGLSATLFQIAPYMGLSFGIYSSLNAVAAKRMDMAHSSPLTVALSYVGTGAVAGLLSKLTVYPLDTVKKRMQMRQVPRCTSYGVIPHYESSWACLRDILAREGFRGLYKGTSPSLIKSVVTHSSTFATYEVALVALQTLRSDEHRSTEFQERAYSKR